MRQSSWWMDQGLDVAVFYRLNVFDPQALKAARDAGTTVVIETDSDGHVSARQNLFRELKIRRDRSLTCIHQLRSWKAALDRWWQSTRFDSQVLASFEQAHWIKIESDLPARILKDFLESRNRRDLAKKLVVVPFAVRSEFTSGPVRQDRKKRIVAAGRLNSNQKAPNAMAFLAAAIGEKLPDTELELHVRGDVSMFATLANRWPNVKVFQDSKPEFLRNRLTQSRILLSTSKWETTPIQGLEALCSGCTIVAPNSVPGYASLIGNNDYGCTYTTKYQAIDALTCELNNWCNHKRDAVAISNHWRAICDLEHVAQKFCDLTVGDHALHGPLISTKA
ncbi:glycosyltransferase [Rhodopirellula sallentina]|nr:glycosyltransferase [Rhodopirellula sallentina]